MKDHMGDLPIRIAEFTREWKKRGGSVAFFKFINTPGSSCERFLDWTQMQGPPDTDYCDELLPVMANSYDKGFYTALTPEFLDEVKRQGWNMMMCCGVDTAACIQKTALDVFDLGWRPFVITDLCASGAGKEAHEAALIALDRAIGMRQVGTGEKALSFL